MENNIVIDTGKHPNVDRQRYMIYYRGGPRPGRIQRNVLYYSDKRSTFFTTRNQEQSKGYPGDYNLYFSEGAPDSGRALVKRLQQNGTDSHSISTDPLFVDFKNKDFRLKPESPMFKLGFKQIETGQIGLREDFPERYRKGF